MFHLQVVQRARGLGGCWCWARLRLLIKAEIRLHLRAFRGQSEQSAQTYARYIYTNATLNADLSRLPPRLQCESRMP
jgi:hypothetical protein